MYNVCDASLAKVPRAAVAPVGARPPAAVGGSTCIVHSILFRPVIKAVSIFCDVPRSPSITQHTCDGRTLYLGLSGSSVLANLETSTGPWLAESQCDRGPGSSAAGTIWDRVGVAQPLSE